MENLLWRFQNKQLKFNHPRNTFSFIWFPKQIKFKSLHDFHCDLLEAVDIAVDISLQIWHPPAPINKEEADWQEYLEDCSREVAPVTNVTESERLKKDNIVMDFCVEYKWQESQVSEYNPHN